uniref:Uncharacterized protein n=1 Tax=Timema monikensis TaxID=170555 RepID=A0A7R9EDU7_9NEOP|nr:unnamed protein product [Timema monikensis]
MLYKSIFRYPLCTATDSSRLRGLLIKTNNPHSGLNTSAPQFCYNSIPTSIALSFQVTELKSPTLQAALHNPTSVPSGGDDGQPKKSILTVENPRENIIEFVSADGQINIAKQSTIKKPKGPKFVQGKLAVCNHCGYSSTDFFSCQRCGKKLPDTIKSVSDDLSEMNSERRKNKKKKSGDGADEENPPEVIEITSHQEEIVSQDKSTCTSYI